MKLSLVWLSGALCLSLCLLPFPDTGRALANIHDPRALAADPERATSAIAPRLEGLGDHHFKITTDNPDAQYFFDQGFRLFLGFNHSEALRSFKESARLDPNNAMAYWGMALVLGPNLNLPMQANVVKPAYEASRKALALMNRHSEREQVYIRALATRYAKSPEADRGKLDRAYVEAMAWLVKQYPDDLDAAVLYAAAIMNTNPWDYWYKDGSPKAGTRKVIDLLNGVIARDNSHAGAHHYLIHTVEAYRPELGEHSADSLRTLMPGAGHLVHMPSHIYMRIGRYQDSYTANALAIKADEGYISQCRAQGLYPLNYYPHNIHFLAWSAMFQGRSKAALAAARQVAGKIPADLKGNTWGLYETFLSQPMFVMVRFGLWDEVLAQPKPGDEALFMQGIWHYGRGMAYNHQGQADKARIERDALAGLQQRLSANPNYYVGFGAAGTLLEIAATVLAGEVAATQGDYERAIALLGKAVRLEDSLQYNEPPDWYFPVRHVLGAVLLEAGLPNEAETVYWEDLRRHPANGFSLFGLWQSLEKQGKIATAKTIKARFDKAWQAADRQLVSSRF